MMMMMRMEHSEVRDDADETVIITTAGVRVHSRYRMIRRAVCCRARLTCYIGVIIRHVMHEHRLTSNPCDPWTGESSKSTALPR